MSDRPSTPRCPPPPAPPARRDLPPGREEQARIELGHTAVRPAVAAWLSAAFLAILGAGWLSILGSPPLRAALRDALRIRVPAGELPAPGPDEGSPQAPRRRAATIRSAHATLLARLRAVDDSLDRLFPAALALRQPVHRLLATLGAGDDQVVVGRDGWLYYLPDLDTLTGPGIDPAGQAVPAAVQAVADFGAALAAHDIRLLVLPTPTKPSVHPEGLGAPYDPERPLSRPRGFDDWQAALAARGIEVLDCGPVLQAVRAAEGRAYLRGDTHWTPQAADAVAKALALRIGDGRRHPPADPPPAMRPRPADPPVRTIEHVGDTARLLALPAGHRLRRPERVEIAPVEDAIAPDAGVVVLGDSFANLYSSDAMGWGAQAGLAERLALHLQAPVRPFIRNADGAWASRARFARALGRGEASLTNVHTVVWQFSERELALGDWRDVPLSGSPSPAPHPRVPPGAARAVRARIAAVSDGPRTDAPYTDFLMTWHLVDLRPHGPAVASDELPDAAVAYLFGMRDRRLLPPAAIRPGADVVLHLSPWSRHEAAFGTLKAGTLDDPLLEIELPLYWAELETP